MEVSEGAEVNLVIFVAQGGRCPGELPDPASRTLAALTFLLYTCQIPLSSTATDFCRPLVPALRIHHRFLPASSYVLVFYSLDLTLP